MKASAFFGSHTEGKGDWRAVRWWRTRSKSRTTRPRSRGCARPPTARSAARSRSLLARWHEPMSRRSARGFLPCAISLNGAPLRPLSRLPSELFRRAIPLESKAPELSNPSVTLARLLARGATANELALALAAYEEGASDAPLAKVLATELDIETGRVEALAASLARSTRDDDEDELRDRALAPRGFSSRSRKKSKRQPCATTKRGAPTRPAKRPFAPRLLCHRAIARHSSSNTNRLDDARSSALIVLEAAHSTGEDPELLAPAQGSPRQGPFPSLCGLARRATRSGTRRVRHHRGVAARAATLVGRRCRAGLRFGARSAAHCRSRSRRGPRAARGRVALATG